MGCKINVDSRLAFGANHKIIEAEVARKKNEYMKNEELAHIFELYKSMKVILFYKQIILKMTYKYKRYSNLS